MAYSRQVGREFDKFLGTALTLVFESAEKFILRKSERSVVYGKYKKAFGSTLSNKRISNDFHELKRNGYVEDIDWQGERAVRLTNKGKIKIIEKIVEAHKSDDKIRFVSFDIPERLHRQRDLFRRTIKRIGFRQIQQSLWVTDKNVGEMVDMAASEFGISDYVAYIVSSSSNIDNLIKEKLVDN